MAGEWSAQTLKQLNLLKGIKFNFRARSKENPAQQDCRNGLPPAVSNQQMQMLIERELRAGSRRPVTYWGRFLSAAIGAFVVWQGFQVLDNGASLFWTTATIGFALCVLDAVRRAAASVSEEKEDGTIGFLLLTPLSGHEILVGKLLSSLVAALPLALALTPIFAVSILLGGVSGGEILRLALALLHAIIIASVVGILVSANFRNSLAAFFITLICLGMGSLFAAPLFMIESLRPFSPLSPILFISDSEYSARPHIFWTSLILSQTFVFSYLRFHGAAFLRNLRDEEILPVWQTTVVPGTPYSPATGHAEPIARIPAANAPTDAPRWFDGNPMTWLTLREMSMHSASWVWTLTALLCALAPLTETGIVYPVFFAIPMAFFLCVASAWPFGVLKRSALIGLIVTSSLGVKDFVAGHRAALRKVFFWPFAITLTAITASLSWDIWHAESWRNSVAWLWLMYGLSGAALLLACAPWVGMWMGLRCKTPGRAVVATFAWIFVLPAVAGCFFGAPFIYTLLGFWARARVYHLLGAGRLDQNG